MPNLIDLNGQHFGTFTVCGRAAGSARAALWLAVCNCGQERPVRTDVIRAGKIRCARCDGGANPRHSYIGDISTIISDHSEFVTECGCQIWMGGLNSSGYGVLSFGKVRGAAPDHLFLGTPADNFADMVRKGRYVHARHQ